MGRLIATSAVFIMLFFLSSGSGGAQQVNHWETAVMSDDIWRYFVGVSEPPSNWNQKGFNDSGWAQGRGGIGYGDNDDQTVLTPPVTSVYIRRTFSVADAGAISLAVLHVDFDDGFVAYLNGNEIARVNLGTPGIRPPFNQLATVSTYEAQLPQGGIPARFVISEGTIDNYLVTGENVLCLQVHNVTPSSSDLSSTTFLSFGITNSNSYFRPVPPWFNDPLTETSKLPVIVINTQGQTIPDEPKILATCKVIDNGPGQVNSAFLEGTDYSGLIGIEVRGQSSQMFPKKSFQFEIRSRINQDSSASLLGMPSNEDWILHAHYSDKSMLRNAISFYLGGKMSEWQPRFRYCVVYLNGDYHGIYLLMESIKRGEDRLSISSLRPYEIYGKDITGGYIVKVDKTGGLSENQYFITYPAYFFPNSRNYKFTYVYPSYDSIASQQKQYISDFLTEAETVLNSSTFTDKYKGYHRYFDAGSFVDFQIIQELSNNVDGYRFSTFFYKKKESQGDKLHAGPLWDFDLCYGNVNYSDYNLSTSGWLYTHYGPNEGYPMHWWARMMEDPDYIKRFIIRWRDLRNGPLRTDAVMHFIDSIALYIGDETDRNFQRWPILGVYVWPNYFIGSTYEEEVNWLKSWINSRLTWMDGATDLNSALFADAFEADILAFPNPVYDEMSVVFSLRNNREVLIELTDLAGRKRFRMGHNPAAGGYQYVNVNLATVNSGYYIMTLWQDGIKIGARKIIKY